ncbi:MAG TPA: dihydroxyacetone kinase subunit DhaL [Ruminiclostridium sp.]
MESFKNEDGLIVVNNLVKTIQSNKEYLSEVDGAIGDGDHGVNMNKGFTLCQTKLGDSKVSMSEALNVLGRTLIMEIGGSMGPLYGTIFMGLAKACKDKETIDKNTFAEMLQSAMVGLQAFDKAKVGDKTLVDTLVPAIDAFNAAISCEKSFKEALEDMKLAAEKGKESTKDMVAKIGRASRLGERSRGTLDAGATSCNLILQSMADSILELTK